MYVCPNNSVIRYRTPQCQYNVQHVCMSVLMTVLLDTGLNNVSTMYNLYVCPYDSVI